MVEFTSGIDADIMRGMVVNHQGSIESAKMVLEHGRHPEVRTFG